MQELAQGLTKNRCMGRLAKLYDQHLAFVSLERDLFSLMLPKSYVALNDPQAKDAEIEKAIAEIIDHLFCVIATWGSVPVIRCQRGGAAEHVARALDSCVPPFAPSPSPLPLSMSAVRRPGRTREKRPNDGKIWMILTFTVPPSRVCLCVWCVCGVCVVCVWYVRVCVRVC